jgi:transcriptional regulator with XRE-family HTH domain
MAPQPVSEATREFGARVRAQRTELGWSLEKLADECGIHWSMVGQIERGLRNVGLHNILKLAAGLKVDPGELVRGMQPPME